MNHLLTFEHETTASLLALLNTAETLKKDLKAGQRTPVLSGKTLALIFQKPSTRTRVSFEVGMKQLGGDVVHLQEHEMGLGKREPIADVAQVLSRYVDGIMIRANSHADIEALAASSSVPVINGLSDLAHPCQALADVLTLQENFGRLDGLKLTYIGDGNNVCYSLIEIAQKLGIHVTVACPKGYEPVVPSTWTYTLTHDPMAGAQGAHALYTDVWASMGQESEHQKRLQAFSGFTVTTDLMNQADSEAIFLHCLPAHRGEEVAAAVLDQSYSKIFDQAENRMHAQKGLLVRALS
ncbi:MAG: ornithine carbamoyltransferase [Candidatus Margulisiibacteriota bacterium]